MVEEDYTQPGIKLDYVGDGAYSNWDRFGRVTDQVWSDYGDPGNPADDIGLDHFSYGYDIAGNRTYRVNVVAGDLPSPVHLDEVYQYDEVYRLIGAERGDLDLTDPAHPVILSTTTNFAQDRDLDSTGNWSNGVDLTRSPANSFAALGRPPPVFCPASGVAGLLRGNNIPCVHAIRKLVGIHGRQ